MSNQDIFDEQACRAYEERMQTLKQFAQLHTLQEQWQAEDEEHHPEPMREDFPEGEEGEDLYDRAWDRWNTRAEQEEEERERRVQQITEGRSVQEITARIEIDIELSSGGPADGFRLFIWAGEIVEGYYYFTWWNTRHFSLSLREIDMVATYYEIDPDTYRMEERY